MFHHVVAMQFNERADQAFFDKAEEYCERIRCTAKHLRCYVMRKNLATRSDGLTHVILASFDTSADHDVYQVSDVHVEMKAFMIPRIARIVVCDIDDSDGAQ